MQRRTPTPPSLPPSLDACMQAWLDEMDEQLPQLRNFILPGGGKSAAFMHHARSVRDVTTCCCTTITSAAACSKCTAAAVRRLCAEG